MFSLNAALTAAPDVNQESKYFSGYNSGWSQMSDAMQRLQKKRGLDQDDRRMSIDIWKTNVNANLQQQQINLTRRAQDIGVQTQAWAQSYQNSSLDLESQKILVSQQQADTAQLKVQSDIDLANQSLAYKMTQLAKSNHSDVASFGENIVNTYQQKNEQVDTSLSDKTAPMDAQKQVLSQAEMTNMARWAVGKNQPADDFSNRSEVEEGGKYYLDF